MEVRSRSPREVSPGAVKDEPTLPTEDAFCDGSSNDSASLEKISKTKTQDENAETNERNLQLKQFQHLLTKSKFYTRFLFAKIEEQKQKRKIEEITAKAKEEKLANKIKECKVEITSNDTKNASTLNSKQPPRKIARGFRKRKNIQLMDVVNDDDLKVKKEADEPTKNVTEDTFSRKINGEPISDRQPKLFSGGVMRSYQIAGFEWLKILYENGLNGILADEMGLGKTIQSIAVLSHMIEMGVSGPFLVCAPVSVLKNWTSEFEKFAPLIPVILYHGSIQERLKMRKSILKKIKVEGKISSYPVIITSYEIIIKDRKFLQQYRWKYLIVDEGHRLKNFNCKLFKELKCYQSVNRLLLTGTPLQNNLAELWSLLNFLLPEIFDKLRIFESWFDVDTINDEGSNERIVEQEKKDHVLSTLHEILSPFLLRRLKSDVELFIPPKKELLVYAPLTQVQQEFYKHTTDKTILDIFEPKKVFYRDVEKGVSLLPAKRARKCLYNTELITKYLGDRAFNLEDCDFNPIVVEENDTPEKSDSKKRLRGGGGELMPGFQNKPYISVRLQNVMMQLRKCCNHPYLLNQPLDDAGDPIVNEELVQSSGKVLVLDAILPKLKKDGHKVLIFSQMTRMLDILQDYCKLRNYEYSILDGRCVLAEREEEIARFNEDPETFIFLLSTRAGGLGLNLMSADTVIIYDSDWNPQCDLQAMDRCHRIGQTRPVLIYRLVTANTIDQRVVERAASKRKLEKMVMYKDKFKSGGVTTNKQFKTEELLELLQSKDHEQVIQSGTVNCVFTEDELDALLDRSSMLKAKKDKSIKRVFKVIEEECDDNKFRLLQK